MYYIPNLTIQLQICLYMLITKKAGIEVSFVLKRGRERGRSKESKGGKHRHHHLRKRPPSFHLLPLQGSAS